MGIPEEDKDKLIKFSTSSIHPSKFKLRQTKVLTEDNEEDRKLQKRRHRVLAWGVFLPIFLYYVYTIYFKEMVIDLEIEDKVEGVFPGYILRRMGKDAEYKEKMILLRPQLEEEFEKFMKEQKEWFDWILGEFWLFVVCIC